MLKKLTKVIELQNLFFPSDYSLKDDGISQSLLSCMNCPMRFCLKMNRWFSPSKWEKCSFGDLFHHLLCNLYLSVKYGPVPSEGLIQIWIDDYMNKNMISKDPSMTPDDIEYIRTKAFILFVNYIDLFQEDWERYKVKEVERTFNVLTPEGWRCRGKIDNELEQVSNNNLFLMEHKTKGRIQDLLIENRLGIDFQNHFYTNARQIETGKEYAGIIYNIVRNTSSKPSSRNAESFDDWQQRLDADIRKRPDHYFVRFKVLVKKQSAITWYHQELVSRMELAQKYMSGELPIFRNTFACEDPWPCEFLQACQSNSLAQYRQGNTLFPELEDDNGSKKTLLRRRN